MVQKFSIPVSFLKCFLFAALILFSNPGITQQTYTAGPQYARSSFHQWLWGKHYRKDWTTPVAVPSFYLDTAKGGLTPYMEGGGRQSKTLRLWDPNKKEYVMRSIDKSFGKAIPEIYQGTFIENILNDQVTISTPFAALTIPPMAEAAKIYHTKPVMVYIPEQKALDSFSKDYGNRLYMVEQRPDENWEEAANFGNSKKIQGTDKMLEKIFDDNDNRVDQLLYIRSRLFDMMIGDASRHEDQWRWASFKDGDKTTYKPIPRDRDQAYAKFEGVLLSLVKSAAGLGHLQSYGPTIPDVNTNTYPARNLDRQVANEPTKQDWISTAKELQGLITNEIIESSVKLMPPEAFPNYGNELIANLKSRRDHLHEYAEKYYLFLAKEVEVVGTKGREWFTINSLADGNTSVQVSKIKKSGEVAAKPFYTRTFLATETNEIRLYGLAGKDVYQLQGDAPAMIKLRIIGGTDRDSLIVKEGTKTKGIYYDNYENDLAAAGPVKLRLSRDTAIHVYKYDAFKYNDKGLGPVIYYNYEDKIHVGLAYKIKRQGWRKTPYASKHTMQVNYSVMQRAFSFVYEGDVRQIMGKWDLLLYGNYDLMRWTNYFGLGNESKFAVDTRQYYRMESKEALAAVSLGRLLTKHIYFNIGPLYQMVEVLPNKDRFVFQHMPFSPKAYESKHFGGGQAWISFNYLNDPLIPTKGIYLSAAAKYLSNLKESDRSIMHYNSDLHFYLPLSKRFVVAVRSGAATITGKPEFYQYPSMGGSRTLRGYQRDRFWGKSTFFSANELQYLFNFKSRLFNGKAGIIGFYDLGRVWHNGETSDTWHDGYGGGIMLSPFNMLMGSITVGRSSEGDQIHVRLAKVLK